MSYQRGYGPLIVIFVMLIKTVTPPSVWAEQHPVDLRTAIIQVAKQNLSEALRNRSLEDRPIWPAEVAHGFIFFPGEASSAKELRIELRELETGRVFDFSLPL
jgi:hypothetical protein